MFFFESRVLLTERHSPFRKEAVRERERGFCKADTSTLALNCVFIRKLSQVICKVKLYRGCPGLVVMGGDSNSRGRMFESKLRIIFHICCMFVLMYEKTENNRKEAMDGPFLLKNYNGI